LGQFHPFLAVPPDATQSRLHHKQRRIVALPTAESFQNRGHFLTIDAAITLLWLAIRKIEGKRSAKYEKERAKPGNRKASDRLIGEQIATNWKEALAKRVAAYPDRINPYL